MKTIALLCTPKCSTGCRHCMFDSVPKGKGMSIEVVKDLKKGLERRMKTANNRKKPKQIAILFTGGGEPLQWPILPEAVSILKDIPGVNLYLTTSGCMGENDERFFILKEVLKQAKGKIAIGHSFNLFSPTFPQRLAFTLPFILSKSVYREVFISMVNGLSEEGNCETFHFTKVRESLEKALKQAIGNYSKLIHFSYRENNYDPDSIGNLLKRGRYDESFRIWLSMKAFRTPTAYIPYALPFRDKRVFSFGSFVNMRGRATKFFPVIAEDAAYNFGYGFACSACSSEEIDLSTDGKFLFCSEKDFPPFNIGKAGDNVEKILRIRKRLALKDLNLLRQDITELGLKHPCDNCIRKAWEIYYGMK